MICIGNMKVLYYCFPKVDYDVAAKTRMCASVDVIKEIAADGVSEMLDDKINALNEESYRQYLKYHFYICEKPEMLGHSSHLLFVGRK